MGPPVAAVVFDLDDTLAVTTRSRDDILAAATETVGAPPLTREAYLDAHSAVEATETREPIFARLVDAETAGDLADAYREAVEAALEPLPGAATLVAALRDRYRVGLLTDGPRRAQHGKLDRLGWWNEFDAVVVTGTLPAQKPDPRTFATVCAELDVDPEATVYVGDKPEVDIAGAAAAGLRPVQVLYDGGPDPHPAAVATVHRDSLAEELPPLLETL